MSTGLNRSAKIARPCKVYDVDKKQLIGSFESLGSCADFLGISTHHGWVTIRNKGRNKTNRLGLTITIR